MQTLLTLKETWLTAKEKIQGFDLHFGNLF